MKSHFYLYHEGQTKRGTSEICAFVFDYITNHIPETVKELHISSDSCPDQKRNCSAVRFLAKFAADRRSNKIFQYFPVRGRYNRDFGIIKKVGHK
jgi:uncharacterized Zn finger protein